MRVQATKTGFYNQYLHEAGEVFDLLDNEDGTVPLKMQQVPVMDTAGKPTGEFNEELVLINGEPVHRDFAPDGEELVGLGTYKGERFQPGWMRQVPDDTPLGIYPADHKIGMPASAPIQRTVNKTGVINAPRATPTRGTIDRTARAAG